MLDILKKNHDLQIIDNSKYMPTDENSIILIKDALNKNYNSVKASLKPLVTNEHIENDNLRQNWYGLNFDYHNLLPTLQRKNSFKVVSFYTKDKIYEKAAANLKASLDKLHMDYEIVAKEKKSTWEENCAQKSNFIYDMWLASNKPIVWIDADATVKEYPILFDYMSQDFAIHKHQRWAFLSGTLFFNKTSTAEELLKTWCQLTSINPKILDQTSLDFAWQDIRKRMGINTFWLPSSYTKIFDKASEHSVIEHHQASRDDDNKRRKIVRRIRSKQRYFRKYDLLPPNISLWDKFLDTLPI